MAVFAIAFFYRGETDSFPLLNMKIRDANTGIGPLTIRGVPVDGRFSFVDVSLKGHLSKSH